MGYYTLFLIRILNRYNNIYNLQKLKKTIETISGYFFIIEGQGIASGEIKWYDNKEHMKEISKKYPKFKIKISGKGEEENDWWSQIYLNGDKYEPLFNNTSGLDLVDLSYLKVKEYKNKLYKIDEHNEPKVKFYYYNWNYWNNWNIGRLINYNSNIYS